MKERFAKFFIRPQEGADLVNGKLPLISSEEHEQMAFHFESAWYREACILEEEEYALAYDELFAFVGQDMEHPDMLGGELSFTIAGREYVTDRTCMILIPKYIPHGAVKINRADRPVFAYIGGSGKEKAAVAREFWKEPVEPFRFEDYVLHANGIDQNEAEQEVLRLHGEDNRMLGGFGGDFYGKFRWFKITTPEDFIFAAESHSHGQPELLNCYSTDPDDPYELGAEVEMEIQGEKHRFHRTTSIFVPSNQPHCPLSIKRVDRPFMFFTLMPDCKVYTLGKN